MDVRSIGIDELDRLLERHETVLIEVLGDEEYQAGHIPGAINIPQASEAFDDEVQQTAPEHATPIIVYCADEDCQASPKAAKRLAKLGYKEVYDFSAGKKGWRRAGRRLEGTVRRVQADIG